MTSPKGPGKKIVKAYMQPPRVVDLPPASTLFEAREQAERSFIADRLHEHRGQMTRVAEACAVSRKHLYMLCEKYGLRPGDFRDRPLSATSSSGILADRINRFLDGVVPEKG